MDRREALKALSGLATAAGLSVTQITEKQTDGLALVIIKVNETIGAETARNVKETWAAAVHGTALEHTRAIVLGNDVTIELVKEPER